MKKTLLTMFLAFAVYPGASALAQGPDPQRGGLTLVSAVSRKTHNGAGTFDINLPLSGTRGVECRVGGVTGDYWVVFTFNNPLLAVVNASVSCGSVSSKQHGERA